MALTLKLRQYRSAKAFLPVVAFILGAIIDAHATPTRDEPLRNFLHSLERNEVTAEDIVEVEAIGRIKDGQPVMAFRLKNRTAASIAMYASDLPWANTYSIRFVAMTAEGQVLEMGYPIDDPSPTTIEIAPGQVLEGDYPLSRLVMKVPRDKDVLVLWSYRYFRRDLDPKQTPLHTGVVMLHTPK